MRPVGYLINYPSGGTRGERGGGYNYILAGNGLFVSAESGPISSLIPIAEKMVRGLPNIEPFVRLTRGKIPVYLFELALNWFLSDVEHEHYAAIVWDNGYHLECPDQDGKGGSVEYKVTDNTILELHSHGKMKAFFSGQDNRDEQGFHLYGVVGKLDESPVLKLRVGCYGYYQKIKAADVFDGDLTKYGETDDLHTS